MRCISQGLLYTPFQELTPTTADMNVAGVVVAMTSPQTTQTRGMFDILVLR